MVTDFRCWWQKVTIFAIFRNRNLILKVESQFRNEDNLFFGPFYNPDRNVGDFFVMLVIFSMYLIGHQYLKLVHQQIFFVESRPIFP